MAGELLELVVGKDRALLGRVTRRFLQTIEHSFKEDASTVTRAEVTRRFGIIEKIFRELLKEHKWSLQRALDELPLALRCTLDRKPWDPSKRQVWVPPPVNLEL